MGGYQRRFGAWASGGVTASWAGAKRTRFFLGEEAGRVERRLITVMADARAHWFRRPSVELYSGLALGLANWKDERDSEDDEGHNTAAFHVTPLGVRAGRNIGVFLEAGVGWHKILKAGLSARW